MFKNAIKTNTTTTTVADNLDFSDFVSSLDDVSKTSKKVITGTKKIFSATNLKKNAVICVRCSNIVQTDDDKDGLGSQTAICIDYAIKNDFNIISIIKDVVPGHDISKMKIYNISEEYPNSVAIFADPSRMSRNVSDADLFLKDCAKNNIVLHFARDNLTSETLTGRGKILDLVHLAYIESQTLSKRISSAISAKRKLGSHIGNPSFGYHCVSQPNCNGIKIRKLEENETETNIISVIKMMYYGTKDMKQFYKLFYKLASSKSFKLKEHDTNSELDEIFYGNISCNDIANVLNDNNIFRRNKEWSASSVKYIIDIITISEDDINYYSPVVKRTRRYDMMCD